MDTTVGAPSPTVQVPTSELPAVEVPLDVTAAPLGAACALAAVAVAAAVGVTTAAGVDAAGWVAVAVALDAGFGAAVPPQAATARARAEIAMIFFIWELPGAGGMPATKRAKPTVLPSTKFPCSTRLT